VQDQDDAEPTSSKKGDDSDDDSADSVNQKKLKIEFERREKEYQKRLTSLKHLKQQTETQIKQIENEIRTKQIISEGGGNSAHSNF